MPSETASSASSKYRSACGGSSSAADSIASRTASAISLGVISWSVGPSETASTNAMARRMWSPASRTPDKGSRLLGRAPGLDHQSAVGFLAHADRGHIGVVLQGEVDGAPLEGLHRVKRDRVAGHLDLARGAEGDLSNRMFAALPVALDVDDHAPVGAQLAHQHVDDRLQRPQVLAPPADQRTQVRSEVDGAPLEGLHRVKRDRVAGHLDLARGAEGDLSNRMFAALPVALDVDDHAPVGAQLAHQHVDDRLQRPQVLAPPADQRTQV